MTLDDGIRLLILSQGAFITALCAVVVAYYSIRLARTWQGTPPSEETVKLIADKIESGTGDRLMAEAHARAAWLTVQEMTGKRGLLPFHVMLVATAHLIMTVLTITHIYPLVGTPGARIQLPLALIAFIISNVALVAVMQYEGRRITGNAGLRSHLRDRRRRRTASTPNH